MCKDRTLSYPSERIVVFTPRSPYVVTHGVSQLWPFATTFQTLTSCVVHASSVAGAILVEPISQGATTSFEGEYVLAPQAVQAVDPVALEYSPSTQFVHVAVPVTVCMSPLYRLCTSRCWDQWPPDCKHSWSVLSIQRQTVSSPDMPDR